MHRPLKLAAIVGAGFSLASFSPLPGFSAAALDALDLHALRGRTVLRNVPPATVFVFTRNRSRAIVPRSTR